MISYIYNEIKYGGSLYINSWKKLLFHPRQAVKDIARAIRHPIKTVKALGKELKKHPIGVTVNIGLNWATGKLIGEGIEYLGSLRESVSPIMPTQPAIGTLNPSLTLSSSLSNNPAIQILSPDASLPLQSLEVSGFSSTALQMVQQAGGCGCGGVCATATTATMAGQMGQTASLSSQSQVLDSTAQIPHNLTSEKKYDKDSPYSTIELNNIVINQTKALQPLDLQRMKEQMRRSNFAPYFDTKKDAHSAHSSSEKLVENNRHNCKSLTNAATREATDILKTCTKTNCKL